MIEKLATTYTAGEDVYAAIFRADGKVFDFDSNTWVTLATPPVTPVLSVTERAGTAGDGFSRYWAEVDFGLLNDTGTPMEVDVTFFNQVAGSPVLADDTVIETVSAVILYGVRVSATELECVFVPVYRTGEDRLHFAAQLRMSGQVLTLDPAATCTITVRQAAPVSGGDLWTIGPTTLDANGEFSLYKTAPTLGDDPSVFRAAITIENDGVTYYFEHLFPNYC